MCLNTITQKFKRNNNMKIGYKLFRKGPYNGQNFYRNIYFDVYTDLYMGEAYTAKFYDHNCEMPAQNGSYKPFFHIFEELPEAMEYRKNCVYPGTILICEVFAWDIRTTGTVFGGWKCFIAKSYRLMREIQYKT